MEDLKLQSHSQSSPDISLAAATLSHSSPTSPPQHQTSDSTDSKTKGVGSSTLKSDSQTPSATSKKAWVIVEILAGNSQEFMVTGSKTITVINKLAHSVEAVLFDETLFIKYNEREWSSRLIGEEVVFKIEK